MNYELKVDILCIPLFASQETCPKYIRLQAQKFEENTNFNYITIQAISYTETERGLAKSFIVDEQGNIESVVLDYDNFKRIESIMLDLGLAKAMEEVLDDEEVGLKEAKRIVGFKE